MYVVRRSRLSGASKGEEKERKRSGSRAKGVPGREKENADVRERKTSTWMCTRIVERERERRRAERKRHGRERTKRENDRVRERDASNQS